MVGRRFFSVLFVLVATVATLKTTSLARSETSTLQSETTQSGNKAETNPPQSGGANRVVETTPRQVRRSAAWDFFEENDKAITTISTFVIAAFTAALFIATYLLWFGSKKTAERQLRAYVSLTGAVVQFVNINSGGRGIQIVITLKNSGQTPGYEFTTWIKPPQVLPEGPLPFDAATPLEQRTGKSVIGPGDTVNLSWTMALSDADVNDLLSGQKKIFVWGGADYTDAFKYRRRFVFRDTNAPFSGGTGALGSLQPHKIGYDSN